MYRLLSVVGIVALSACGGSETSSGAFGVSTQSGFSIPTRIGQIREGLAQTTSGADVDFTGNGYGYQVGVLNGNGLRAFAGVTPNTTVSAPPRMGTGTYTGTYEVASGRLTGGIGPNLQEFRPTRGSGPLDVTVNYDTGAFSAASTTIGAPRLTGQVNGTTLTGTVRYGVVTGELRGLVGGDRAVGAFHGSNSVTVFAGGFSATRD